MTLVIAFPTQMAEKWSDERRDERYIDACIMERDSWTDQHRGVQWNRSKHQTLICHLLEYQVGTGGCNWVSAAHNIDQVLRAHVVQFAR